MAIERDTFRDKLQELINTRSRGNTSRTPDYILADYLAACLGAFETAVDAREAWYGARTPAKASDP